LPASNENLETLITDLSGKTALITAAAQGIGRTTAERFARAGAHMLATDINFEKLSELKSMDNIKVSRLDVLNTAAVTAFFVAHPKIDMLFNCAGVVHNSTIPDSTKKEIDFAFDLNVKAQWRAIRTVLPSMLERGDGLIINMASLASLIKGVPNCFTYSATKAAVIGLTKLVTANYVSKGICCNAICPSTVESPSLQDRLRATGDFNMAHAASIAHQPIGRIGTPEEIAELALYLAGATYTTGHIQIIDGGWTA
jgi:2-keto-3-deoxy-L-fuconate dehydrogenase